MTMLDEQKIKIYMQSTNQKSVLIRHDGEFYLAELSTELTAWENYPIDSVRIRKLPPPIELV